VFLRVIDKIKIFGTAFAAVGVLGQACAAEADAAGMAFFEKNIRPVLANSCYQCHSAEARNLKGELFLDSKQGMLNGGESGPVIVPGKPAESRLLQAIRRDGKLKMPPRDKLSRQVADNFAKWIGMGAPDPRVANGGNPVKSKIDLEAGRKFWSFIPPDTPNTPVVADNAWPRGEIDRFVLAKLEANNLSPVRDATRHELIRRTYFDLIGLPPSPGQVAAFLSDTSANAFEKVVDELLRSPHFGEHWGRHWLDVARYSESNGMERNFTYPHAWRYRDYVIDSFNDDKSFRRFVREQVAGDLLGRDKREPTDEELVATGFLALGPKPLNQGNKVLFKLDVVDEQIDVTTRAFLGLTVSCARCHDHKFDPIPTRDYYAMAGIFRSTDALYGTVNGQGNRQASDLHAIAGNEADRAEKTRKHDNSLYRLNGRLLIMEEEMREYREKGSNATGNERTRMRALTRDIRDAQANIKSLEKKSPDADYAMGVRDGRIGDARVLVRGEIRNQGQTVKRGFPQVMDGVKAYPISNRSSGRLQLANWLTQPDNPLTSRVMANRIWHHLFGAGIVRTMDNFGATGERPTHPGLLDYLAVRFVGHDWSVKSMIREMVLSRTYQLSSDTMDANAAADPSNRFLWRMNHKRLGAEALRDAMLATSGRLDRQPAGGSVVTKLGNVNVGRAQRQLSQMQRNTSQRSVYLPILRNALPEMMRLFDTAEPSLIVGKRNETTVPTQALYLMNNPFVIGQAFNMAKRVMDTAEGRPDGIRLAYELAFARAATDDEVSRAHEFLNSVAEEKDRPGQWTVLCQALLASAEFRYID
jgi:hypothetical protein